MPSFNVVTALPGNPRALTITTADNQTFRLPRSPSTFDAADVWSWGQVDRQGQKAMTRRRSPGLRTASFSITVFAPQRATSMEDAIDQITRLASHGKTFRISGGSRYLGSCWWYPKDIKMSVLQLTPDGRINQAQLTFDLEEYVNPSTSVVKPPPPPKPKPAPVKKPSPKPAKAPVYRYHTVVRGDWLSKLAIRYLGRMERWPEIHKLNPWIKNPNLIYPGQKVKIPPK